MNKNISKKLLLLALFIQINKGIDFTWREGVIVGMFTCIMAKLFHTDSIQKETQSLVNQNYMELKTLITLSQDTIIKTISETFQNLNTLRNTFNENQIILQKKYNALAELIKAITAGTAQENMQSYQNLLQTQTQCQEKLNIALNEYNKKLQLYEESFKKLNIYTLMDDLNAMKNEINSFKNIINTIKTDIQNNFHYQMSLLKTEFEKEINNKNTYTCNFTKQIADDNAVIVEKKVNELNKIFKNSINQLLLDIEQKLINQENIIKKHIEKAIIMQLPLMAPLADVG